VLLVIISNLFKYKIKLLSFTYFGTVSRICSEAKKLENSQDERVVPWFKSPRKTYKRAKIQTELDDFDGDIVRRIIH